MDRIQFRRDTLDNWNSVNPILLEGEIGYVLDDPNLYKMGDGVHTWDQLPFRGFDGTIVQETGSNENAVMSQKATTEAINNRLGPETLVKTSTTNSVNLVSPAMLNNYEIHDGWVGLYEFSLIKGSKHIVIPIKSGFRYKLEAKETLNCYAVVLSDYTVPTSGNTQYSLSSRYTKRIELNENSSCTIDAFSDAKYIVIGLTSDGVTMMTPKALYCLLNTSISIENKVDVFSLPLKNGFPSSIGTLVAGKHCVIEMGEGVTYKIEGADIYSNYYASVLTSYSNPSIGDSLDYSSEYPSRYESTPLKVTGNANNKYLLLSIYSNNDEEMSLCPIVSICIEDTTKTLIKKIKGNIDINDCLLGNGWIIPDGTYKQGTNFTIPVEERVHVKIKANSQSVCYYAFFKTYNSLPNPEDFVEGTTRYTISAGEEADVLTPVGCKYIRINGILDGNNAIPEKIELSWENNVAHLSKLSREDGAQVKLTFGAPTTILSNELDTNEYLSYYTIVQLKENLFYMYYDTMFGGETEYQELHFAYSTDGRNYTKGIPSGIVAPYSGTNKLMDNVTGSTVVKVPDGEYPFRLITQQRERPGSSDTDHYINMYKSKDGINFESATKRTLMYEYHDTQHSVVVKGNILKVYTRYRKYEGGLVRKNCVYYFDLDGNMLSPMKVLDSDCVYNAAAVAIDDEYDLISPTFFDNRQEVQDFEVKNYLVKGYTELPVDSNINSIFGNDDKWVTMCPSLLTISGKQYMCFVTKSKAHDVPYDLSTIVKYKMVEVTIER